MKILFPDLFYLPDGLPVFLRLILGEHPSVVLYASSHCNRS